MLVSNLYDATIDNAKLTLCQAGFLHLQKILFEFDHETITLLNTRVMASQKEKFAPYGRIWGMRLTLGHDTHFGARHSGNL